MDSKRQCTKLRNKTIKNKITWTKSELNEFAIGLQKYGFSQKEKLAETISTRDKSEVLNYLNTAEQTLKKKYVERKRAKARASPYEEPEKIVFVSNVIAEVLEGPPIRKWNWMARSQQSHEGCKNDYSRISIGDILEDFYEEADTPENPQVIDVKAIYKFLLDCVEGKNPTELMPKESGLVLMLLKKLKELQDDMDLDDEKRYFADYKGAVKFAPAEKDKEENDSQGDSEDDEAYNPEKKNAVKIPREIYKAFRNHQKLVESFNPLLVPLWFLSKHQAALEPLMKNILGNSSANLKQESSDS